MKTKSQVADMSCRHWGRIIDTPKWRALRGEPYLDAFEIHELAFIAGWNAAMREKRKPRRTPRGEKVGRRAKVND